MNPLAQELNDILEKGNSDFPGSLAAFGREIFFPKGILTQSAEAKAKAHRFNATILPVVTAGLTHGLSVAADMFIEPGDVIIMPDKLWGNYRLLFELRKGAKISTFPLYNDKGGFNIGEYKRALHEAKGSSKIVTLLNFPNNPTGFTPTFNEMKEIGSMLINIAETGQPVIVFCDDAYFGLFYEDDTASESIFSILADSHPKLTAVKLDGATKEDFVWGFRVGFITVSTRVNNGQEDKFFEAVEKKLGGTVRSNISNAPAPSQSVLLHAMGNNNFVNERNEKRQILKARAIEVKNVLSDPKYADYFTAYPFNSGYFMCVKLKQGLDAEKFRKELLEKEGTGVIAIGSSDIRIAFSSVEKEDIKDLFDAMHRCASNM